MEVRGCSSNLKRTGNAQNATGWLSPSVTTHERVARFRAHELAVKPRAARRPRFVAVPSLRHEEVARALPFAVLILSLNAPLDAAAKLRRARDVGIRPIASLSWQRPIIALHARRTPSIQTGVVPKDLGLIVCHRAHRAELSHSPRTGVCNAPCLRVVFARPANRLGEVVQRRGYRHIMDKRSEQRLEPLDDAHLLLEDECPREQEMPEPVGPAGHTFHVNDVSKARRLLRHRQGHGCRALAPRSGGRRVAPGEHIVGPKAQDGLVVATCSCSASAGAIFDVTTTSRWSRTAAARRAIGQ
eukprot:6016272-Prymnesium_polylepis.1